MFPAKPEIVMGTASLGLKGAREDAYRLLDAYLDLGGSIIDSAAVYSEWVPGEANRSETVIGEWLRSRKAAARPLLATKGGHPRVGSMDIPRLDRDAIRSDVEDSLRALGVEQIDLYYLHRDDVQRPVADIMGTLGQLVGEGKIGRIGLSNWDPERVSAARAIAPSVASTQLLGNALCRHLGPDPDPSIRTLNAAAFADAEAGDLSILLFSSQAGGMLSKRARGEEITRPAYRTAECLAAMDQLIAIAKDAGVEPTNLAVAFLLGFSPRLFPIIGSSSTASLQAAMEAGSIRLSAEVVERIAAISGFALFRQA